MNSRHDYARIEQEYIQGDDSVSYRSLGAKHQLSFSAIAVKGRKGEWERKRGEFRARMSERSIELSADKAALKISQIREDALTVIQAAIMKMGMDLRDRTIKDYDFVTHKQVERTIPGITVTPADVTKLIASFQTMIGQASAITENRNLGITIPPELPPDILRAIADAATERGPERGPVGRAALPSSGSTRTH